MQIVKVLIRFQDHKNWYIKTERRNGQRQTQKNRKEKINENKWKERGMDKGEKEKEIKEKSKIRGNNQTGKEIEIQSLQGEIKERERERQRQFY